MDARARLSRARASAPGARRRPVPDPVHPDVPRPGLRRPALDGSARLDGPSRGAALDRRVHPRPLLLHVREPLPLALAPLPMSDTGEAQILVLGWNFRGASGAVRERVAFSSDEV